MFPQATEVIMRFLSRLGSTACMLTLLAVVAASPIVAQTRLPLRDYGYDRRYEKDRSLPQWRSDRDLSGQRGLSDDRIRRDADLAQRRSQGGYMDLRTHQFDDRGSPLSSRPSVDGRGGRSFSD